MEENVAVGSMRSDVGCARCCVQYIRDTQRSGALPEPLHGAMAAGAEKREPWKKLGCTINQSSSLISHASLSTITEHRTPELSMLNIESIRPPLRHSPVAQNALPLQTGAYPAYPWLYSPKIHNGWFPVRSRRDAPCKQRKRETRKRGGIFARETPRYPVLEEHL